MLVAGVLTFSWLGFDTFNLLLLYTLSFGFFSGGFLALMPSVAAELFGVEHLGSVIGLLRTCMSVGSFIAGPLGGVLYTMRGDYTLPIIFAGVCLTAGALLVDWMSDTTSLIHLKSADIHLIHTPCQEAHISQRYLEQHSATSQSSLYPSPYSGTTSLKRPIQHASLLQSAKVLVGRSSTKAAPRLPPPPPLSSPPVGDNTAYLYTSSPSTARAYSPGNRPNLPTEGDDDPELAYTDKNPTFSRQSRLASPSESSHLDESYTDVSSQSFPQSKSQSLLYKSGKLIMSKVESALFTPPSPRADDTYALVEEDALDIEGFQD